MLKIALALTLTTLACPMVAGETQSWIGLQGGYDWQQDAIRKAQSNYIYGLTAGLWCTPRWGGDLSLLDTKLNSALNSSSGHETHGQVSALFNLAPGLQTWKPYLRAGFGGTRIEEPFSGHSGATTKLSGNIGAGIQALPTRHLLLGLEGRAMGIESRPAVSELMALFTVGYRFGGSAPAPAPEPAPAAPEPAPAPAAPAPAPVAPQPAPAPAPAPAPVVQAPAPAPAPAPTKIVLNEAVLHFANSKAVLSQRGVDAIRTVATSIKAYPGKCAVTVTGFTSSVGSVAFNKKLSKQRAEAVAKVLEGEGIPADSITTEGAGPDRPIADNKTAAGQARNRRVEIELKPAGAAAEIQREDVTMTAE